MDGIDDALKNLNAEILKIEKRAKAGMVLAALEIRADAMKLTPVVTGNLRNSAYVVHDQGIDTLPVFKGDNAAALNSNHTAVVGKHQAAVKASPKPEVRVGFTASYATFVHENPRAGKTGGVSPKGVKYSAGKNPSGKKSKRIVFSTVGQWKFLETALKQGANKILAIIVSKVKG